MEMVLRASRERERESERERERERDRERDIGPGEFTFARACLFARTIVACKYMLK